MAVGEGRLEGDLQAILTAVALVAEVEGAVEVNAVQAEAAARILGDGHRPVGVAELEVGVGVAVDLLGHHPGVFVTGSPGNREAELMIGVAGDKAVDAAFGNFEINHSGHEGFLMVAARR
ncbi:MAG: hypothetical protein JWP35_1708 [Caulobacter sp.]|nr:hypothetical protein [Caulobacter sp.]